MKFQRPAGIPNLFYSLALALGVFVVYLRTLSAHVGTEDPGEIATALHGMGILHPTGYPLYTLIGSLFARLPLGDTVIWRLNLFSALLTALAAFLFHRTFLLLLSDRVSGLFGDSRHAPGRRTSGHGRDWIGATSATLMLAFSAQFWTEAVSLEVYAFHLVFLAIVLRLFVETAARPGDGHRWLLFAYVLGLSFTHHMMTVLLGPAFLVLFFQVHGFGRAAWERIVLGTPFFLLALTGYLYLPLRSSAAPLMNWGEPTSLRAIWQHVTAAQYGDQMFSSARIAWLKFLQFGADLPGDFGYAPLALAAAGIWSLRRRSRLLVFTLLVFATGLFYSINYAFEDPNFNLNAHVVVALWAGLGASWLVDSARGSGKIIAGILVGLAVFCPLAFNYPKLDKSRDSMVEDYARNVLESMDSGAVFFSNEYERLGSPAFYLQNVEGFRKDIVVLDIILLGNPWYYGHLEQRAPWLMSLARPEIGRYRTELSRFMAGGNDTVAHNLRLREMFFAIVEKSRSTGHPVYVSGQINPTLIERYQHAPTGMVFRLLDPEDTIRAPLRLPRFNPLPKWNPLTPTIRSDYAQSYAYQGAYLAQGGDTAGAIRLVRHALELQPVFPDVEAYLKELQKR